MARGESLLRQWKLLNLLQSRRGGISLRDLAGLAGYGERTIQRDLKMLQEAGFPVDYEADEFGKRFWRLPREYLKREGMVLSLTETVSLYFARQMLAPLAGTSLADGFESIHEKICSLLPESALEHFRDLHELILVRSPGQVDYGEHREAISLLAQAVRESRTVELTYRSVWRRETYTTNVDPYGLVYFEGDLYLVGRSARSQAIRVFKLTRMAAVRLTPERFQRPRGFSLEEHFAGSFGIMEPRGEEIDVAVAFDAEAEVVIEERRWHPSQRLRRGADGRLVASYRLGDLLEFRRWVLGFGPRAEVLKPKSLRQEIEKLHREAAARHAP